MSGYLPLTSTELKAWAEMTGNIVRREEWAILRDMDGAFLDAVRNRDGEGGATASGSTEITAAAFDAVFG